MKMNRRLRLAVGAALVVVGAPMMSVAGAGAALADSGHVSIPSNYVYNPDTNYQRTLHDYCTKSPDAYRPAGKDADFRGGCARHDLCIMYGSVKRSTCDAALLSNLKQECEHTYGGFDPRRYDCISTAAVYYAVVRAKTAVS